MKQTQLQDRRDADEAVMQRVITLMCFETELLYCQFKYATGLSYLLAYLGGNDAGIDMLERNAIFWKWWRNQWLIRDEELLVDADRLQYVPLKYRRAHYMQVHNPRMLAAEITPNAKLLRESYADMIEELHKERV